MLATSGGQRVPVQRLTLALSHPGQSVGKSFCRQRRRLHAEKAQSALTIILILVMGGLTRIFLMVLGALNPQFPEKAMATYSSTLAWKIPWMEKPDGLQFMGSLKVGHD